MFPVNAEGGNVTEAVFSVGCVKLAPPGTVHWKLVTSGDAVAVYRYGKLLHRLLTWPVRDVGVRGIDLTDKIRDAPVPQEFCA
jgi:hypothetical protein